MLFLHKCFSSAAYEKLPEPQAYSSSSFLSSPPMSSSSSLAQTQNLNRFTNYILAVVFRLK